MSTDSDSRGSVTTFGQVLRVLDQTLIKIVPLALLAMALLLLSESARRFGGSVLVGAMFGAALWAVYDMLR
jgi:hypothetical protein